MEEFPMKYITIYKWTHTNFREFAKRWTSQFDGSAPQAVKDGLKKIKVHAIVTSPVNQTSWAIWETEDIDAIDVMPVGIYLQETCEMQTYPVQDMDAFTKSWEKLDLLVNVPKPAW